MELTRRPFSLLAVAVLALATLAAADAATISLTSEAPALVRVSGPGIDTTVEVAGTVDVALVGTGMHQVEHLASTVVPACDDAVVETSGLLIEADGATTPLGAASGVDVDPGATVDCSIGG